MEFQTKLFSIVFVAWSLYWVGPNGSLNSAWASAVWVDDIESALEEKSLEEELNHLLNSSDASPCDQKLHPLKLEMVRALQQNQKPESSTSKQSDAPEIPFGNGVLVAKEVTAASSLDPTGHSFGWKDLYQNYKIRRRLGILKWNDLDREVRAMISDDRIRVRHKQNLYLTPTETQMFVSMIPKIEECLGRPECEFPKFDTQEKTIASKVPYIHQGITERSNGILDRMRTDLVYHTRKPYRQIRAEPLPDGKITLKVPLVNASALEFKDLALFETLIKKSWDQPHLEIDIEFLEPSKANPSLASLVFDSLKNERAYVVRKLGTDQNISLRLFSNTPFTALAHEFGHVLGFNDHYYRVWSDSTCTYTYTGFPGDIMSDHDTGKPTAEELEWLLKTYSPK